MTEHHPLPPEQPSHRFLFADGGREALQGSFKALMKSAGASVRELNTVYTEESIVENRRVRNPSGKVLDRSVCWLQPCIRRRSVLQVICQCVIAQAFLRR